SVGRAGGKRERILEAAVRVFARKGFHATRVSEVAKAAGVADGAIYLYFESKDRLLISLFEHRVERLLTYLETELPRAQSASHGLQRIIELQLGLLEGERDLAEVVTIIFRQSTKLMKEYAAPKFNAYLDVIAGVIAEGQGAGELRDDVCVPQSRARRAPSSLGSTGRDRPPGAHTAGLAMKRLRERARVCADVRRFFDARGFLEVQTPLMVPSPGLDVHLDAFEIAGGEGGSPRWLSTSPEYQMKRLLAGGLKRIYQIAPCFRRGERGARHNPEFTMVEWYRGGSTVADVMRDTEQLVASGTGGDVRLGDRTLRLTPPFDRISVCDAFERFAGWSPDETLAAAENDEDRYFRALVDRVEPALALADGGCFLVDFPATQASLARTKPGDARLAERFELYVAGVELCNGFGELVDPIEQR